ncbi:hypothetical protein [Paraburkholderia sp. RAU2J]|uniref:hypothetical protein n=1 Tax=Paraburkholderia sp. RAU2J TaxID=1938810 RepID=UPI00322089BD
MLAKMALRERKAAFVEHGMTAQHLDKQILPGKRFTDPFVEGHRALLDEGLGHRHAHSALHLPILAARGIPVMRYLARERFAQNAAVAHRVLDCPMHAKRVMAAADSVFQQFGAAASPTILIPYKIHEPVFTHIQIEKRNDGRTAAFRRMDEKNRKGHMGTYVKFVNGQV